jgi:ribosomal-protein-alanine N-acetyltransferase
MKPELQLAQGRLRPTRADDLDAVLMLLHDEAVRCYLCDGNLLPRETVAKMLARSAQLDDQGIGLWVIEDKGEAFAGIAGLEPVSSEIGTAPAIAGGIEPIIALHPAYWGHGLAGAALNALIAYARDMLGLPRLVAAVDAPNASSHRLIQRCGFKRMGTSPGPATELELYALMLE